MKESHPKKESYKLGTMENPIVDSQMTREEALRLNPAFVLPQEIFERQVLLQILYISFDGQYHQGQIVVDKDLEKDVLDFFRFLIEQNFPLEKAIPIADKRFDFNDAVSMSENNSSGFNPRNISGTNKPSNHAFGRAIDINPFQNPYVKNDLIEPKGATYNLEKPGTLTTESPVVKFLKNKGWRWGGDYQEIKDYHHFEKLLEEKLQEKR